MDFTLHALSATNAMVLKCHLDDSARGSYGMILVIDILTELGLNIKISEHGIKADDSPFIGSSLTMFYLGAYVFKYLNTREIKNEELFTDAYI